MLAANILQLETEGVTVRGSEFNSGLFFGVKIQFVEAEKESRGRFTHP